MSSLLSALPAPSQALPAVVSAPAPSAARGAAAPAKKEVPPYLKRANFTPRRAEDFGDGGAFPEVHVAQYPLEMGRADAKRGDKTLAVTVGGDGSASYDAIVTQGGKAHQIVHTGHMSLVPKLERMSKEVNAGPRMGSELGPRGAARAPGIACAGKEVPRTAP
jgi:SNW domain-containing protein 1